MTKVKTYIAQIIKSESINIFEIDEKLNQFSIEIKNYYFQILRTMA